MNMIAVGSFEKTFRFKVLSPVFQPVEDKLLDMSAFEEASENSI